MTDIILCGAGGRMGHAVAAAAAEDKRFNIVAGVDPYFEGAVSPFPIYDKFEDVTERADVIIDFSNHASTIPLLEYAKANKTAVILATTGQTKEELEAIEEAKKTVAILRSGNMSLGVNLIVALAKKAAKVLSDFDVEIVESHHRHKLDAPSGTALMIADAVKEAREGGEYIFDRHERRAERGRNEIGISSVRGGSIVGEHEVIFAGDNEVVKIAHSASSREIFAKGALSAAAFIESALPGGYTMSDLFEI